MPKGSLAGDLHSGQGPTIGERHVRPGWTTRWSLRCPRRLRRDRKRGAMQQKEGTYMGNRSGKPYDGASSDIRTSGTPSLRVGVRWGRDCRCSRWAVAAKRRGQMNPPPMNHVTYRDANNSRRPYLPLLRKRLVVGPPDDARRKRIRGYVLNLATNSESTARRGKERVTRKRGFGDGRRWLSLVRRRTRQRVGNRGRRRRH